MLAGHNGPLMSTRSIAVRGGRIEACTLDGGPGRQLLVLGGVETGLRPLAGTEQVLERRWATRRRRRSVTVVGRPIPDDPSDAERIMHPRVIADQVATAVAELRLAPPLALEAESGGGRISLWLAVDRPQLVERLVLASVASETRPGTPMAERLAAWIGLAEEGRWAEFFARMAVMMKPAGEEKAEAFDTAARFQPRPATPERFIAELRTTLDPSSWVTDRLGEIGAPVLVLAGGADQVVPPDVSRSVADGIPGARFELDPASGHTVRSSFRDYDALVEAFLAEGDEP